ncbi:MAG: glycoside hydrolase family 3 N-terminal domain-containing protein [Candidatus Dormibacter sp.]
MPPIVAVHSTPPSRTPTPTSTPQPILVIGVEATPPPCTTASVLATWTLTRLAQQTIVVPVDESNVLLVRAQVAAGAGGVILFGASAPGNLGAALQALNAAAPDGIKPLIMTDEEGGVVQRMANLVGSIPSPRQMGATMSPAQIQQLAAGLAQRMRANGITMDLAPVLDVDGGIGPNNVNADGTRSFSANATVASNDGVAFAQGLLAGGITPVVKHFPGLGGTYGNTDVTAAATPTWSVLQSSGLLPFQAAAAAHLPAVMIANASVPGLTTLPASLSPEVITGVLRGRLGFQGLVITDSLSAVAISSAGYSVPQATVAALRAGADLVLYTAAVSQVPALTNATVTAIVAAVDAGTLNRSLLESAVGRVLAVKGVSLCS